MQTKPYRTVGLGGTFDHFHIGHKHFLHFAASLGEKILVGISTPELTQHKTESQLIESLETRMQSVQQFFTEEQINGEVFPLDNPYGPTLSESKVEAVAVTEQTVSGAEAINHQRQLLGLPPLPFHVCTLLRDITGELISSTRIRTGEINREGERYSLILKAGKILNQEQLSFFKAPQGKVLSEQELSDDTRAFVVGDIATETFLRKKLPFQLAVFDRRSLRTTFTSEYIETAVQQYPSQRVENQAGQISAELSEWINKYLQQQVESNSRNSVTLLEIDGEEDLVTVALATLAPLSTHIYYGQPNQGIVELIVTEELKERFARVLNGSV